MKTYQPAHYVVDEFTTESELVDKFINKIGQHSDEMSQCYDKLIAMEVVDIIIEIMMQ